MIPLASLGEDWDNIQDLNIRFVVQKVLLPHQLVNSEAMRGCIGIKSAHDNAKLLKTLCDDDNSALRPKLKELISELGDKVKQAEDEVHNNNQQSINEQAERSNYENSDYNLDNYNSDGDDNREEEHDGNYSLYNSDRSSDDSNIGGADGYSCDDNDLDGPDQYDTMNPGQEEAHFEEMDEVLQERMEEYSTHNDIINLAEDLEELPVYAIYNRVNAIVEKQKKFDKAMQLQKSNDREVLHFVEDSDLLCKLLDMNLELETEEKRKKTEKKRKETLRALYLSATETCTERLTQQPGANMEDVLCSLRPIYSLVANLSVAFTLYIYTITECDKKTSFWDEKIVYIGMTTDMWFRHKGGHVASSKLLDPQYANYHKKVYLCTCCVGNVPAEWLKFSDAEAFVLIGEQFLINYYQPELNIEGKKQPVLNKRAKELYSKVSAVHLSSADRIKTVEPPARGA